MVAKSVIILASGRANYASGGVLDDLIRGIAALGKSPILVLGPDGDDLMRTCTDIDSCEIVFDPNFDGGIFSGIKAGLHAVNGPAFVVPLGAPELVEFSNWEKLEVVLRASEARSHVIRPVTQNGGPPVYPQLVTAHGLLPIKALPASTDWLASDRIRVETVDIASPSV